jgi:hypothetical protein
LHGIYTNITHVQLLRRAILHRVLLSLLAFMMLSQDRLPDIFKFGLSQYIFASDHPKPLFWSKTHEQALTLPFEYIYWNGDGTMTVWHSRRVDINGERTQPTTPIPSSGVESGLCRCLSYWTWSYTMNEESGGGL